MSIHKVMHTMLLDHPEHAKPLHETYHFGDLLEVYVRVNSPWQARHTHYFEAPTRMGDSCCAGCGAEGWSAQWVRPGVMGVSTHAWMVDLTNLHASTLESQAEALVRELLGGEVIAVLPESLPTLVADLDPDSPAMTARRAGIAVPPMAFGVLS